MHMEFPTPAIWFSHRVSYGETDTMGVLYYAEYLHIFERARSEYIRALGMSYADVERKKSSSGQTIGKSQSALRLLRQIKETS